MDAFQLERYQNGHYAGFNFQDNMTPQWAKDLNSDDLGYWVCISDADFKTYVKGVVLEGNLVGYLLVRSKSHYHSSLFSFTTDLEQEGLNILAIHKQHELIFHSATLRISFRGEYSIVGPYTIRGFGTKGIDDFEIKGVGSLLLAVPPGSVRCLNPSNIINKFTIPCEIVMDSGVIGDRYIKGSQHQQVSEEQQSIKKTTSGRHSSFSIKSIFQKT